MDTAAAAAVIEIKQHGELIGEQQAFASVATSVSMTIPARALPAAKPEIPANPLPAISFANNPKGMKKTKINLLSFNNTITSHLAYLLISAVWLSHFRTFRQYLD
jgi:hypothetical protein